MHSMFGGNAYQHFESRSTNTIVYIVPRFRFKTSSFRLRYQHHSSSADCNTELLKGSNGLASLLVGTGKKIFWLGVTDFL